MLYVVCDEDAGTWLRLFWMGIGIGFVVRPVEGCVRGMACSDEADWMTGDTECMYEEWWEGYEHIGQGMDEVAWGILPETHPFLMLEAWMRQPVQSQSRQEGE